MVLRTTLQELGHEVTEAVNGQEALEKLHGQGPFDLAMVDWNMPVMTGIEFVVRLRTEKAYDAMKVIMVTTEVEIAQVDRALKAGVNEYVMKPFTKEMIQEKIEMVAAA